VTDLLILANSYKNHGRCLAGVDSFGQWVRPVSDSHGGAIDTSRVIVSGQLVMPGHVVQAELGAPVPLPYQCENVLLGPAPINFAPTPDPRSVQARLSELSLRAPEFASTPRRYFDDTEYVGGLQPASLAVVRTPELKLVWRTNSNGWLRPRAVFMTDRGGWDLPYTGEQWEGFPARIAGGSETYGDSYVTLSVGGTFDGGTEHYVFAGGILPAI
jgi:hypothetical protein